MARFAPVAHVISVLISIAWHQGPMLADWVEISQTIYVTYTQGN